MCAFVAFTVGAMFSFSLVLSKDRFFFFFFSLVILSLVAALLWFVALTFLG